MEDLTVTEAIIKEAVILAGGLGTRLKKSIKDIPKPMAPMADGRPFLEHLIEMLAKNGIKTIVLSVGYKSEKIIKYFGNKFNKIEIKYAIENDPLGTGGAIKKSLALCSTQKVLVLNGDTYLDLNSDDIIKAVESKHSRILLMLKKVEDSERYGTAEISDHYIISLSKKHTKESGLINTGYYITDINILDNFHLNTKFSFEDDFLQKEIRERNVSYHITEKFFIDIGIPEDYQKSRDKILEFKNYAY